MLRVEVFLRGGAVVEVECEDFTTIQGGPLHRIESVEFVYADDAKSNVIYIDFTEMVALKYTELDG